MASHDEQETHPMAMTITALPLENAVPITYSQLGDVPSTVRALHLRNVTAYPPDFTWPPTLLELQLVNCTVPLYLPCPVVLQTLKLVECVFTTGNLASTTLGAFLEKACTTLKKLQIVKAPRGVVHGLDLRSFCVLESVTLAACDLEVFEFGPAFYEETTNQTTPVAFLSLENNLLTCVPDWTHCPHTLQNINLQKNGITCLPLVQPPAHVHNVDIRHNPAKCVVPLPQWALPGNVKMDIIYSSNAAAADSGVTAVPRDLRTGNAANACCAYQQQMPPRQQQPYSRHTCGIPPLPSSSFTPWANSTHRSAS